MGLPTIVSSCENGCRRTGIETLNRIGVNVHITTGRAWNGGSGAPVSCLLRLVFAFVQRFTRHHTRTRPLAGKILKLNTRFEIEIPRNLLIDHDHFIVVGPLSGAGAEDIEAIGADGNHFARQRRGPRFGPGVARIGESNRRAGDRVRRCRGIVDSLNRNRRGRTRRQSGDGQNDALVVHHAATGRGVFNHTDSVGGRQAGHHARARHLDSAGESVIARRRPGDGIDRVIENNVNLRIGVVARRSHGLHGGLGFNRNSAEAGNQQQRGDNLGGLSSHKDNVN